MTESLTQHYRMPGGALAVRTVSGMELPELPEGATALTSKQYDTELKRVKAQQGEHKARLAAEDQERMRGDYDALRALGVPEATASRLTGFPVEEPAG